MSGILVGWMGRRGLVSISCLYLGAAACLVCPALCGKVLPALLKGPLSFASGTLGGCSHRKLLQSENVGYKSLWKLGSLVSYPAACGPSCCSAHTFAFSGVFAATTGHLVSAKEMTLFPPTLVSHQNCP